MYKLITAESETHFNKQLEDASKENWTAYSQHQVAALGRGENGTKVIYSLLLYKPEPPPKPELTDMVERVIANRHKQIHVKGYTVEHDVRHNDKGQLLIAAQTLVIYNPSKTMINTAPSGWVLSYWRDLMAKPYSDRLAIAASFLCAEGDRLFATAEATERLG